MKTLFQRLYPGELPRPSVEIQSLENEKILIVGTPWGTKDALKELGDLAREYFSTSLGDSEATSPFSRLPGLSQAGNTLRVATMLANEAVLKKFNKETYNSACEALLMTFDQNEMSWIQIGQPHLLLVRGQEIQPLSVAHDLSVDFDVKTPLPTHLLGIEKSIEFETRSLAVKPGDRLLMVARSSLPKILFAAEPSGRPSAELFESLFNSLAKSDPTVPFWIGLFEI